MYSIKPDYYDNFFCIADKCPITCCQEWKISVDEKTQQKWSCCAPPADTSPLLPALDDYVTEKDGEAVIALNEKKQCPFLNNSKLCKLVLAHGDSILSETCAQFPKQFHTFEDRTEYSLAPCCPEVVRLLTKKEPVTFINVPDNDADLNSHINLDNSTDLNNSTDSDFLYTLRTELVALMQNTDYSPQKALLMIFYILLDIKDRHITAVEELKEYRSGSILCKLSKAIDDMSSDPLDTFDECNELLLDLLENYRREQLYTGFLTEAALLAEDYADTYEADTLEASLKDYASILKQWEHLLRNYLIAELFSNLLLPESTFEDMLVAVEWTSMEYAAFRQLFFLKLQCANPPADSADFSYSLLRDAIVIISRVMGYDEEDIHEYLKNSFQSLIWDWGYLALLLGK